MDQKIARGIITLVASVTVAMISAIAAAPLAEKPLLFQAVITGPSLLCMFFVYEFLARRSNE